VRKFISRLPEFEDRRRWNDYSVRCNHGENRYIILERERENRRKWKVVGIRESVVLCVSCGVALFVFVFVFV
jgi:hypothetical protein